MELHQIRYFLAACETLNFTRAAELRNVSQPALTKAIHMLEYELGGPLFDTQSRPIQLTALGELLRDRFSEVEDMLTDIKSTSYKFHRMEDSTFTIGIINTIGDSDFIDVVRTLQEQLLGVSLVISHASQQRLTDELKAGKLELAIVTAHPIRSNLLEGGMLYSEPYVLTVSPDHPLAERRGILLNEIEGEDYVQRTHCEKNAALKEMLEERNISVQLHLGTDQDDFARQMIVAGLGISIMPVSLVKAPLKAIPIEDVEMRRELRLVHRKDRLLSPVAIKVRDAIISKQTDQPALKAVKNSKTTRVG
ncbi:MAG: LysR family transcriptional regulator [Hyphomonadaceae bacterium]